MSAENGNEMLRVEGLTAGYRGRTVVWGVDLHANRGEVVVLLGSNGAGKTTTLSTILGLVKPQSGTMTYDGDRWAGGKPWNAASKGMTMISSERFTFGELSVRENLTLGGYSVPKSEIEPRMDAIFEQFPILAERREQLAGTMSGGQQRMLSLGMALMSEPKMLLLDEPSLGLAPTIVDQLMETVRGLVDERQMSVLMVEQNVGQVLSIADRAYVMRSGRILLEESADEMRARDQWWDLF
ncbi:MAG: ABC transporter ATP-binding protein [Actinomycetota bacterium]|nr:ABC transporter ATP-binding protein [Actinomycetota bacterium]